MNKETRRGFLKIGAAILGSIGLVRYSEPIIEIAHTHEWIEDKGDYAIVRVPDFKSFANEVINKPAIFIMGRDSVVKNVNVDGFVNFYAPNGGRITNSRFDSSQMVTENSRSPMNIKGQCVIASDCVIICNPILKSSSINFDSYSPSSRINLSPLQSS
jgi:hypothetical protein